jgi:mycothiol system anti-sigma-R factor
VDELISCRAAVERLWAYLDHELDVHDHDAVDAHLALCRRCCGELEFAKHLRALLTNGRADQLPAGVRERLDRFIDGIDCLDDLAEPANGLDGRTERAVDLTEPANEGGP